jgi:ppGpp synthetase/RelA/SpoT-type nucleotidyltranferase
MLLHKHYIGAAHSFEILKPEDPIAGKYVRPDVAIIKTFYIDDTANVNDWQATWEGLKIDAEELPGTPIVLKEDLEHPKYSVQEMYDRGTIFDYDIDEENHKIIVYARITDLSIVERIKSGELEYVSPALIPRGSEYLTKVNGVDVLSRTLPLHLCIVGEPAYGKEKAKISHLCEGDGEACYSRLKTMTANVNKMIKREHELLDQGIPEDEVHEMLKKEFGSKYKSDAGDGTGGENSGIKSKLKLHQADEGIPALEQIPFIKKMKGDTARIASEINKIRYGSKHHIHKGREGRWTNIQGMEIFVAMNQSIKAAMADQCGCTKMAATVQEEKGNWITVKGTHIFIPDGADIDKTIKEHFDNLDDTTVDKHKPKPQKDLTNEQVLEKVHSEFPNMSEKIVKKNLELYREREEQFKKLNTKIEKTLRADLPGTPEVSGRVKKPDSAIAKIARKPKYADVTKLQDVVAVRATYDDIQSVKEAMKVVREKYDIIDEDDYIGKPKFDGYRSYHAIMKDKETGIESELQIRTQRQDVFANWAHDLYKPPNDDLRNFVETHKDLVLGRLRLENTLKSWIRVQNLKSQNAHHLLRR